MKKRLLILGTLLSISMIFTACGQQDEPLTAEDYAVEESAEEADNSSVEENTEETTETVDDESEAEEDSDDKYMVFTDKGNDAVEAYATKIKEATLAKDWDTIGDMFYYPLEDIDGRTCKNKEEFIEYAKTVGFEKSFYDSLEKWTVDDLWANAQGAAFDDGIIGFQDLYVDDEHTDFRIVSFGGLYRQ